MIIKTEHILMSIPIFTLIFSTAFLILMLFNTQLKVTSTVVIEIVIETIIATLLFFVYSIWHNKRQVA